MNADPGLKAADFVQVWIGVAVSLSAFFGWLLWRVTRLGTFQTMPNVKVVVAKGHSRDIGIANIRLEGPTCDRWTITQVTIRKPKGVQFLRHYQEPDEYGGGTTQFGEPIGRTLNHPQSMIAVTSLKEPVSLVIKMSLKAFPKITSLHPITISNAD